MINFEKEIESILSYKKFDCAKIIDNDIVLYGAGALGKLAIDFLNQINISPKYIIDKTKSGMLEGLKIISPVDIPEKDKEQKLFIICISTVSYNEIVDYLKGLGIKTILHFFNYFFVKYPTQFEWGWFKNDPTKQDLENVKKVCTILQHDECSLHHYLQYLWWKFRCIEKNYVNFPVLPSKKYFFNKICDQLTDQEIYLDCGCHYGQSIESFIIKTNNKYNKIIAVEPDITNLEICKKTFTDSRIQYINFALSNKSGFRNFINNLGMSSRLDEKGTSRIQTITIDDLSISPTLIKMHCEGEELYILEGAKNTLNKFKPKLMVVADHNDDALWKIPLLMHNYGYKLYFNLHAWCGNQAVYYGI